MTIAIPPLEATCHSLNGWWRLTCKYPTTYEYGIAQPMNKIVLTTLLQLALNTNKDIVEIPRKKEGMQEEKRLHSQIIGTNYMKNGKNMRLHRPNL